MRKYTFVFLFLFYVAFLSPLQAQWESQESVLSRHTWYKIGVTEEGVYGMTRSDLQALGVDVQSLRPAQIRMFGNEAGMLPEENAAERYDDLTEMAIQVIGGEDGSFDEEDMLLFYGQGPVILTLNTLGYYEYVRHPYTDTIYYFLCVDSQEDGLRIQEKPSVEVSPSAERITSFLDVVYHESEELSPYASGRTWYGDLFTPQEGFREFVFDVPGLITSASLRFVSMVLGRCSSSFEYSVRVGDQYVVDHYGISSYSSQGHEYGKQHYTNALFNSNTDQLRVRFELEPTTANPMLFIDYFYINLWRSLRLAGHGTAFRFTPTQLASRESEVRLGGWRPELNCWEVTDPLRPGRQQVIAESDEGRFGLLGGEERRYYLFDNEGVKSIASARRIPCQNLHAYQSADFLIITPSAFWASAEALADFHRVEDGMQCLVVDVQEIFNEFGSGTSDPTSLRDFIRMLYLRGEGQLKYVLLFGKGTHDYRDIKGIGNNYVPTYELKDYPYHEVYSMCSDDFFGLMDRYEGEDCEGLVDLGIGRIPITTAEQGTEVVEKIKHYADLSVTHGPWRNDHLFMTDNNSRTYITYVETLERILDTACPTTTVKKLYLDSYPVVTTPSGTRSPLAHDELLRYFDQGFCTFSYTGHGGVKSLTEEWVLAMADIVALDNYDHLPFVHTATCEFSKFDNPTVVSGGEMMMLNPHGGAIALLTTLRPTIAQNNQSFSRAFHVHLHDRQDGRSLRFGDIYRLSKADSLYYSKMHVVYSLFGDPALRFEYPNRGVKTTAVNGQNAEHDQIFLVSGLVTVEGVITDLEGMVDSDFNGVLDLTLYDQKSNYTSLGTYDSPMDYSFYHDELFKGKAKVEQGRFTVQLFIPAETSPGSGLAHLSYYAFDSLRKVEAQGVFDYLKPVYDPAIDDHQGPDIHLYWDRPEFVSGDTVSRNGTLYADLFDEQGIYHYNFSIGRDIVLKSNLPGYANQILNECYEPGLDDYRRGRITLPVEGLDDGRYDVTLKAWDTQNNSTEVEIAMYVEGSTVIAAMRNIPNPFSEGTYFSFVNGDLSGNFSVTIEIFDILGRRVALLDRQVSSDNGLVEPIYWDGHTDNGSDLRPGVYVYRMRITGANGYHRVLTQRMVKK